MEIHTDFVGDIDNLDEIIKLVIQGTKENWTRDRLLLETGLNRHDLSILLNRLKRQGWELKKGYEPFKFKLGTPLTITGDCIIVGDIHVPLTDWWFSGRVSEIAKRHLKPPKKLIIAGDFFNFDAFSLYAQVIPLPTWRQEREAAYFLINEWLDTFDEIYAIMGNHERRLQRFTAGAFDTADIWSLITTNEKLLFSKFGYCNLESKNTGLWRITHQKNYSILQLNVADALAHKHKCNIVTHHEHHSAIGRDRYKNYIVVNNGSLVDPQKLAYVALDDSKGAGMAKSFLLMKNGYPYLMDEKFTDWDFWL